MSLPFQEKKVSKKEYVRTFSEDVDSHELKWHKDKEDRLVIPLKQTNWLFQRDNQLPEVIQKPIKIKANEWHRVIKGDGDLVIKITKL